LIRKFQLPPFLRIKNMKKLIPIPVILDPAEIQKILRVKQVEHVKLLMEVASPLIQAEALYNIAYIEEKAEDRIMLQGTSLRSRVLRKNLDQAERVFPFIITLGPELEKEIEKNSNIVDQFYLDAIGNIALGKARKYLEDYIKSAYRIKGISFMSPGSLKDWPLEEQKPLFTLMGDTESTIGVRLSESLLMVPKKSVSGIFFPTEVDFYNCQLCPRKKCPGRRAAYNQQLAESYGVLDE